MYLAKQFVRGVMSVVLIASCAPQVPAKLVQEFTLPGKVALLLSGTARTRFGDIAATPALRDFKKRWVLVVKDAATGAVVAQNQLVELDGDTLETPWFVAAGPNRLWMHDTHQLKLVDLATATVLYDAKALLAKQPVFVPPSQIHSRRVDNTTGTLAVRNNTGHWFLIDENLNATPTSDATVENHWRDIEADERHGCHTKHQFGFWGGPDLRRVTDMFSNQKQYGKLPPDDEPGHTYLQPSYFVDKQRHCLLDDPRGPLVFQPETLIKNAPMVVSLASAVDSKELWRIPLSAQCQAGGMPVFADQKGTLVTLVFGSGSACQIDTAAGKVTWSKTITELAGPSSLHRYSSAVATPDAIAVWLWLNDSSLVRVTLSRSGEVKNRHPI